MGKKISKAEKQRREAAKLEKAKKKEFYKFMGLLLIAMGVMWLVGYFFNGTELAQIPVKAKVESVEVTNTKFSDETKILTTDDELKLACSAMKLVRAKYEDVEHEQEPYFTMVFHMKSDEVKVLQISDGAVTWNGETKKMVRQELTMDMMDSVFFPEYVEEEDGDK